MVVLLSHRTTPRFKRMVRNRENIQSGAAPGSKRLVKARGQRRTARVVVDDREATATLTTECVNQKRQKAISEPVHIKS